MKTLLLSTAVLLTISSFAQAQPWYNTGGGRVVVIDGSVAAPSLERQMRTMFHHHESIPQGRMGCAYNNPGNPC